MKRTLFFLPVAAVTFGVAASGFAQVLVRDTWQDGTRNDPAPPVYSEHGFDADGDGDLESAWFKGGGGTLSATPGNLAMTLAATGSSSWTTYFTTPGNPVTLGAAGDKLQVTWVFTPTDVNTSNGSQSFRLALVNSPTANRMTSDASPGTDSYTGYGMFMNMGVTLGHSSSFQLRERAAASGAFLSGNADWVSLANGAGSGVTGYASGTEYTFLMTLERNGLNGLDIFASMTGGNIGGTGAISVSFTDTTPNNGSFSFDTFGIRPSDAATTAGEFDTSLFQVEFVPIPEPTVAALLGLGLLGLLVHRRR
jgi:hypothetical protein